MTLGRLTTSLCLLFLFYTGHPQLLRRGNSWSYDYLLLTTWIQSSNGQGSSIMAWLNFRCLHSHLQYLSFTCPCFMMILLKTSIHFGHLTKPCYNKQWVCLTTMAFAHWPICLPLWLPSLLNSHCKKKVTKSGQSLWSYNKGY